MKCTLRKTEQGVVATIDKRPKQFDYALNVETNEVFQCFFRQNHNKSINHTIIASTFGVGKGLQVDINGIAFNLPPLSEDEFIEYDYTETETQIIVQL